MLGTEPLPAGLRIPRMKTKLLIGLAALLSAGAVSLFGLGDDSSRPTSAVAAAPAADVGALANQFTAASSATVTQRLERAVASNPQDGATRTLLGLAYQQRFRESGDPAWLTRAEHALDLAGRHGGAHETLRLGALAQLAGTRHEFDRSIKLARRVLATDPQSTVALGALADGLRESGRYREAFAAFDRLVEQGPSVGAYARVAFARLQLGRRAAALDAMELALEAGSGIPEQLAWARTQYGTLLFGAGRVADAERAFRGALAEAPGYVHARAGLASISIARGRLDEAADRLTAVLRKLPSLQYSMLLADVLERSGRTAEARRAELRVREVAALFARHGVDFSGPLAVRDLDRNVRVREALRVSREGYAAAPNVETADAVAWGLYRTGRCAEARSWSETSLRLGIRNGSFLFHRGLIERCLGNKELGRRYMQEALAADPFFSVRFGPLAERLAAGQG